MRIGFLSVELEAVVTRVDIEDTTTIEREMKEDRDNTTNITNRGSIIEERMSRDQNT